ncbi:ribbon-helix-helix domain-containing protein [Sphingomonas baiyangensis]|uniref:Type II toxin-antitoxin system ParD family antitoxin n=1 Tax=Sphingomonas baiyangensis TaxID=2572576 RepID=A0A4U1L1K8_9SPHN|nr:type II toxin-antitoxin system ParD family antitoxin [Sphingomonas baiyangensis]TKD50013.1 type II toxin-antitoxin system ParD family antitoxin [Sphingomonas baiyangensis]
MATLTLSLPDTLDRWVQERVSSGEFATAADLVRTMLERERVRAEKIAAMDRLVAEAIESGISTRSVDEIFAEARRRAAPDAA